ncbi:MAG: PP2C family protein-serine/threonine phosphatase [Bryobacterales bacterium]|nr:PP2C family protein-serine/threonine phosphatase [Bryobacterales bacterium]
MKTLLLSLALAIAGVTAAYRLFPEHDALGAFPSTLSRDEAIARARTLAARYGRDVTDWNVTAVAQRNGWALFLRRDLPDHPLLRLVRPVLLSVAFSRGPQRVRVILFADGAPAEFFYENARRPEFDGRELTPEEVQRVQADFLGASATQFRRVSSVASPGRGHSTVWEWRAPEVADVIMRLEVVSARDGVRRAILANDFSSASFERFQTVMGSGAARATFVPVWKTLLISLTCAFIFPGLARGRISSRRMTLFGIAALAIVFGAFFGVTGYDSLVFGLLFRDEPIPEALFAKLTDLTMQSLQLACMWGVGRWLLRGVGLDRWRSFESLLMAHPWRRAVGHSVACGLLLGSAMSALPLLAAAALDRAGYDALAFNASAAWLAAKAPMLAPLDRVPGDWCALLLLLVPLALTPMGQRWAPRWLRWVLLAALAVMSLGWNDTPMAGGGFTPLFTGALLAAAYGLIYWQLDLLAALTAGIGLGAAEVAVYFLRQDSDGLRLQGALVAAAYGAVALTGIVAWWLAPELEPAPEETVKEIAARREVLEAEFSLAREAQTRLLPAVPRQLPGFTCAASCIPAREVGGDLYDFFPYADGSYGVCVADVSGKGVPAALFMTLTKGILAAASRELVDLRSLAASLNLQLHAAARRKTFVTMALGRLDPAQNVFEYIRAGHNSILWWRAGAAASEYRKPRGVGLGLTGNKLFERSVEIDRLALAPGDVVVLYSDGITEAMNSQLELFGEDRLQSVVDRHADAEAGGIERAILKEVREFMGAEPAHDDMTLFVLRAAAPGR